MRRALETGALDQTQACVFEGKQGGRGRVFVSTDGTWYVYLDGGPQLAIVTLKQ